MALREGGEPQSMIPRVPFGEFGITALRSLDGILLQFLHRRRAGSVRYG